MDGARGCAAHVCRVLGVVNRREQRDEETIRRMRLGNAFHRRLQETLAPYTNPDAAHGVHVLFRYRSDDGMVHWRRLLVDDRRNRQIICQTDRGAGELVDDTEPITCMECLST